MQAIQFNTKITGTILKIPAMFRNLINRNATVIVLYDEDKNETKLSHVKKTAEQFFSICGIWENREISKQSLREKSWRNRPLLYLIPM